MPLRLSFCGCGRTLAPVRGAMSGRMLAILLASTMAFGLGACGRRGQPEPPAAATTPDKPDAAPPAKKRVARGSQKESAAPATANPQTVAKAAEDEEQEPDDSFIVSPQPTPGSGTRKRQPYFVPKESFILDPLL